MINFENETGQRFLERVQSERVIWLTTISQSGKPQPRPVWFVRDGGDLVVYSNARAKKLKHIAHNPNVSLHFNTSVDGYDVQVLIGTAQVDSGLPPSNLNKAYSEKYGAEILTLDMDEARYAELYSVGIRITPTHLRGLEPIPEES